MIEHLIQEHPAAIAIFAYWVFSAVVGGMPEPSAASGMAYRWVHDSLHILAGNLQSAVAARYPAVTVPAGSAIEHKGTTSIVTPQTQTAE